MRSPLLVLIALFPLISVAYSQIPVKRSAAEIEAKHLLKSELTDSVKLQAALSILEKHGEDIPAAAEAMAVIRKLKDDPAGFFQARADGSKSVATHYLYGRASGDSTIMAKEAQWILANHPGNYWGHILAGYAEWHREQPDVAVLRREFEAAAAIDPGRLEAYLYLGWVFLDEAMWPEAREALDAGAVCDPEDTYIRDGRLTAYAQLRDADAFFALMRGIFSEQPLEADLPLANRDGHVTSGDLRGGSVVLEYWAYT